MKKIKINEDGEGSIEQMMMDYLQASVKNKPNSVLDKYMSMITLRLVSLGFTRRKMKSIIRSVKSATNEKDIYKIISTYKLFDNYSDTFMNTEISLKKALKEIDENKKRYKILLQVPFTTSDNIEQKDRKMAYDFQLRDIEVESSKGINVAVIGGNVIDYQILSYIKTDLSINDLEQAFQPDYKIIKIEPLEGQKEEDGNNE